MGEGKESMPEGIISLLDTDLYKLTMQNVVFKYFKDIMVKYKFTNRTPEMRLSRAAYHWLHNQIRKLGDLRFSQEEIKWLRKTCPYLSEPYLQYLSAFKLDPPSQIICTFLSSNDTGSDSDVGDLSIHTEGLWVETILYEIPLLALTSEAYFKFSDRDWTHDGQLESAKQKGLKLLEHGCMVSEFGSRRRRDYHTHELVIQGLMDAQAEATNKGFPGKITGTSNVHLAKKFNILPIGTMAHEWFMGVAAITNDYPRATQTALDYWIATFGKGVLGIALTDTFGTPHFLQAFKKSISSSLPSTEPSSQASASTERYVDVFTGTRQDSGNPLDFVKTMREFSDQEGITAKKTIVFSDSLNVERCIEYKDAAAKAGFQPSFGVGTFFTNDFICQSTGEKSQPLNIVIKLSSADGRPAIKISDNVGKNTGDSETVARVKRELGYQEHEWKECDERKRWDDGGKASR